jgi:predicted Zn-dependent protease
VPLLRAEQFFRKGYACLSEGRAAEAARHFLTAIQLEREHGVRRPEMRYLSHYGVALALSRGPSPEAIDACETAVERDPENPDLRENLARVLLLAGARGQGLRVASEGATLEPGHAGLRRLLRGSERRARPPVRFLGRDHLLNRLLGRLRASLSF